nr:unnamed protein product [uncultured bacterium]
MSHIESCFITLTYNDDNLPYDVFSPLPSLCKRDVQLFMKRLRKMFSYKQIRFYLCGEYGEQTHRPHYHAIIFGHDFNADTDFHGSSKTLEHLWQFGNNYVGQCNPKTIQYVAGYVTKKYVNKKRDTITPEFTLMSRRPGIGFYALNSYEQLFISSSSLVDYVNKNGILPSVIQFNGRTYPLDRYFKWKLYDTLDISEKKLYSNFIAKLLHNQKQALDLGLTDLIEFEDKIDEQSRRNFRAKSKIYNKVRDL